MQTAYNTKVVTSDKPLLSETPNMHHTEGRERYMPSDFVQLFGSILKSCQTESGLIHRVIFICFLLNLPLLIGSPPYLNEVLSASHSLDFLNSRLVFSNLYFVVSAIEIYHLLIHRLSKFKLLRRGVHMLESKTFDKLFVPLVRADFSATVMSLRAGQVLSLYILIGNLIYTRTVTLVEFFSSLTLIEFAGAVFAVLCAAEALRSSIVYCLIYLKIKEANQALETTFPGCR